MCSISGYELLILLGIAIIICVGIWSVEKSGFEHKRKRRRDYYRNVYLKSAAWKRKRYVVLRRDNWQCVYCGSRATEVHHKRYLKKNIGKEPIDWMVSICRSCHEKVHDDKL